MPVWLTWLDVAVNFCFLADLLVTFFVAFKDKHTYTLVTSHWKIAERYLLSYFLTDLLALFPWNTFYQLVGASGAANLLQWLLWTRVLRMRHLFRYFRRLQRDIRLSYFAVRFLKLIIVEMYITHVAGCFFYYLATTMPPEEQGYTWIGSLTLGDFSYENFREVDLFTRYVTALYWSVVTMATIGYGDIHPVNPREMIFAMFYITVDLILSAYLIGNITALVVKGSNTTKYRERMAQVIKYMNRNRIPRVLRHQMRQHVRLQFETDQVEDNILNDFPVSIRHKVARALYRRLVEQSYIFQGCSPEFINQIVTKVTPEHYFPSEVVIQHRDSPERLYIICSGNVEETSPSSSADGGRHFSELATGSMFGEVAVLCNIPQPFDVSVIEFCQVLRLERDDLNTAINTFMVDGRKIVDNLLERTTETGSKYALLASEITSLIAQQEAELTMTTIYAASRGDIEHLKRLIKAGANAGKADYDGRTPLHLAAAGGYDEVVRFLLLEGADVNSMDNFGTTPLLEALRAGNDSTAKILTEKHGTVNLQVRACVLHWPMHRPMVWGWRGPWYGVGVVGCPYTLLEALRAGNDSTAKILSEKHGTVNLQALRAGNDSTAKILTDKHGTVNLQVRACSLHWPMRRPMKAGTDRCKAVMRGDMGLLRRLLINPNAADYDLRTPLHTPLPSLRRTDLCNAVMRGDTGLLRRLLVNGVNPNAADYDLRTPLHIASAEGFVQVARLLVEHGADVAALDRWGNSSLDEARRCGSLPLIHLLEEAMRERGLLIAQATAPLPPPFPNSHSLTRSHPSPLLVPADADWDRITEDGSATPRIGMSGSATPLLSGPGTPQWRGSGTSPGRAQWRPLGGGGVRRTGGRAGGMGYGGGAGAAGSAGAAGMGRLVPLGPKRITVFPFPPWELKPQRVGQLMPLPPSIPDLLSTASSIFGASFVAPGNIEATATLGEDSGEDSVVSESDSGVATSSVVSELVARVAREPIETIESLDLSRVLEAEVGPNGVLTEGVASAVLVELSRAGKSRHALKLFDWLKARAFLLSTSAHTALIAALARSGPYADAARVLAGMRAAGLSPTVHACTAAMQAQSRAGRWRAALLLLEEMRGMGLKPDTMAYNAVLTACGRAGRLQEVLAVYQAMQDDECRPSTGTRALLMSTFVRANRCDLALQLFFDARLAGQPVTPDMHRGLICVASKVGRWPLALDLLDDLLATWTDPGEEEQAGLFVSRFLHHEPSLPPSHFVVHVIPLSDDLLATWTDAGVAGERAAGAAADGSRAAASADSRMEGIPPVPKKYFEARQDEGPPAAAAASGGGGDAAAPGAGSGRGGPRSSDAGSGERWEGGSTWGEVLGAPNSALPFNALISSLARAGMLPHLPLYLPLSRPLFLTLSHLQLPHLPARPPHVLPMSSPPPFPSYPPLLPSLRSMAGQWQIALSVFSQMKKLGIPPDHFTWSGLASALARAGEFDRAMALFEHMGEREGLQPTLVVCNCALLACQHKAKWQRALQLLWRMERMGVQADVRSYSMVIRTCELAGQSEAALTVYQRMLKAGCKPNTFTLASLIRILGKTKDWQGAVKIFEFPVVPTFFSPDFVLPGSSY
ncbi:unnamed protein product [Closterium sp. NIES-65]|nr:unnamed protein product [Closterium sp. NIES-65]